MSLVDADAQAPRHPLSVVKPGGGGAGLALIVLRMACALKPWP
jgi:hypothetical protein